MNLPNNSDYIIAPQLTVEQIKNIKGLINCSSQVDGPGMSIKSSVFQKRNNIENYLYFTEGKLIGYLNLQFFQGYQAQAWGVVHPLYRRQGIFSRLINIARENCNNLNIARAIFTCDKYNQAAAAFATSIGARYFFSEYRMELGNTTAIPTEGNLLTCKKAENEDIPACAGILTRCFYIPRELVVARYTEDIQFGFRVLYIVSVKDKIIGKFDLADENPDLDITGFCILPEYRRQGFGRQMLELAISEAAKYKYAKLCLEVDCNNYTALKLYQAHGFSISGTLNYYLLPLK